MPFNGERRRETPLGKVEHDFLLSPMGARGGGGGFSCSRKALALGRRGKRSSIAMERERERKNFFLRSRPKKRFFLRDRGKEQLC